MIVDDICAHQSRTAKSYETPNVLDIINIARFDDKAAQRGTRARNDSTQQETSRNILTGSTRQYFDREFLSCNTIQKVASPPNCFLGKMQATFSG